MKTLILGMAILALLASPFAFASKPLERLNAIGKLKMMDANDDDMLTPAEHADGSTRMFMAMDADNDGKVTAAEMDMVMREKGQDDGALSARQKIAFVDRDNDGALSRSEHRRATREVFDRVDADRDGFITVGEAKLGTEDIENEARTE